MKRTPITQLSHPLPLQRPAGNADGLWSLYREGTRALWPLLAPLRLTPKQRQAIGGMLFAGCAEFVAATADAMGADPALFTHVPLSGTELDEEEGEALDLLFMSQGLRELSQLAYDGYMRKMGFGVRVALAVTQHHRLEAKQPFLTTAQRNAHRAREGHLYTALTVLRDRRGGRPRKAPRPKKRAQPER